MDAKPSPPDDTTTLDRYPWVVVRFRCHYCARARDARLAALAARFGANMTIGELRGGYCPDLGRSGPPDLPPSLAGLTLIEGGKAGQLPAEPQAIPARRRIGGE